MKNITLCSFILLCLGNLPLAALKGKDDETPKNPKPVATATSTNASQARPKPKAEARKVVSRPEPFILDDQTLKTLQSAYGCHKEEQKILLENAARAVELGIMGSLTWPDGALCKCAFFGSRGRHLRRSAFITLP